ncbi:DNA-directed RNA polymerase II subunit [Elasticomyces elasticus]|nr:DNA-directed RNA polymerase II subunit [Elasticomyces elasticus]KAK3660514.1 DNA-directed RNA polymerase II subunit [Elasticomyces elasticus]KAK4923873.1 DNA-directed RNA polymerase II subunit [Elasticomyces elasticus]KAK5754827.1 DNA-directed RNA polymerase II subunit [Elasticomyces elasticus]
MFFVKTLQDTLPLHPSYFGAHARQYITDLLYTRNEGRNTGVMIILAIIDIDDISEPKIIPGTGMAEYNVSYRAIIWRPYKGEVVDGLVSNVVGTGFFVAVGGLNVFVSKAMIPTELKYTVEGSTPSFTDNIDQTIERGSQVRLRIKGIRGEMGQMYAIGSIREDFLGVLMQ